MDTNRRVRAEQRERTAQITRTASLDAATVHELEASMSYTIFAGPLIVHVSIPRTRNHLLCIPLFDTLFR